MEHDADARPSSAKGSPHREPPVLVLGVLVLGNAGDVGIQPQVLPPVVEGSERIIHGSRCTGIECIDEGLAFGGVQEVPIEDIETVLHFAVVGLQLVLRNQNRFVRMMQRAASAVV